MFNVLYVISKRTKYICNQIFQLISGIFGTDFFNSVLFITFGFRFLLFIYPVYLADFSIIHTPKRVATIKEDDESSKPSKTQLNKELAKQYINAIEDKYQRKNKIR